MFTIFQRSTLMIQAGQDLDHWIAARSRLILAGKTLSSLPTSACHRRNGIVSDLELHDEPPPNRGLIF